MKKTTLCLMLALCGSMALADGTVAPEYAFTRQRLFPGFDGKTCKIQPSVATDGKGTVLLTWQNLLLTGVDVFYGERMSRSTDGGRTFSEPLDLGDVLTDTWEGGVRTAYYGNVLYSRKNGRWFGLGAAQRYENDKVPMQVSLDGKPTLTPMYYTVDAVRGRFGSKQRLPVPFDYVAALPFGQFLECDDGDLLVPFYAKTVADRGKFFVIVVRYRFDGDGLSVVCAGTPVRNPSGGRGVCEPSLAKLGDRYYVTLRTDERGLWAESADGLSFSEPQPWRWDDGTEIGNYNTQQHWLRSRSALYLAYTRKGANNDHVFRHRAPIFMAKFDPARRCLVRSTERILVPELGARLGNFVCCDAGDDECWLVTAEWMQGWDQELGVCEKYGSDNSLWLVKVMKKGLR